MNEIYKEKTPLYFPIEKGNNEIVSILLSYEKMNANLGYVFDSLFWNS